MGNIVVAPPSRVAIISGCRGSRNIIGGAGFRFFFFEEVKYLDLEVLTLTIKSEDAETAKGVQLDMTSTAQIKIAADAGGVGQGRRYDMEAISLAAQNFLSKSRGDIEEALRKTLEGHQRQIMGTLTVEELYKDRASFSEKVREHIEEDLKKLGFVLLSFTVAEVSDKKGYMVALGMEQSAAVQRAGKVGEAKNLAAAEEETARLKASAREAKARYDQEAHVRINKFKENEAEADRDLQIRKAENLRLTNEKEEEARKAGEIMRARQDQVLKKEQEQQRVAQANITLEYMRIDREIKEQEAMGISNARLTEEKNDAQAIICRANADAESVERSGEAKAKAILSTGSAEAEVMRQKARVYQEFGQAAMMQTMITQLPEIAGAIAKPLERAEKMVFISNNGTAGSQLTGDITRMVSEVPDVVKGLTGVDLVSVMKGLEQRAANQI